MRKPPYKPYFYRPESKKNAPTRKYRCKKEHITVKKNITHKTDACASGFFDADTLLRINLFENLLLPTVTHEITMVGVYKGMSVYTAMGDHQISFLGSGASDNAYLLNIGTATQISTLSADPSNEKFAKAALIWE